MNILLFDIGGTGIQVYLVNKLDNIFITPCSELPGHLHSGCANLNNHFTHKRRTDYPYGRLDPHPLEELYIHHSQII